MTPIEALNLWKVRKQDFQNEHGRQRLLDRAYVIDTAIGHRPAKLLIAKQESELWYSHYIPSQPFVAIEGLGMVRPGYKVVDVGCNIGTWAIQFAKVVGPTGAVRAMDPFPLNCRLAEINLALNDVENAMVKEAGAWDSCDFRSVNHSNQSVLSGGETQITLMRLDQTGWEPDFVKIDVEGAERQVLLGMSGIARKLKGLYVEFHPYHVADFGTSWSNFVDALPTHMRYYTHHPTWREIDPREGMTEYLYGSSEPLGKRTAI